MKLKTILTILILTSNVALSQKNEIKAFIGYNYYEDDFFVNSYADKNGFIPSRYGLFKFSAGMTYSYYFEYHHEWCVEFGVNYAYRSAVIGTENESGFAPSFNLIGNYLYLFVGSGFEHKINRKFSVVPRLLVGLGIPLQGRKEQGGGILRNPDVNLTELILYSTKGLQFKLYFKKFRGRAWWVGLEPRLLIFYNNMFDLKNPLNSNEAPHFAGALQLEIGYSF